MKTVKSKEDLEQEVIDGSETIVIVGKLAQQMHMAFEIKKYGWAVVAAFIAGAFIPAVGFSLSATTIAAITAIGAGLFKSILKGYVVEDYSDSPMRLTLNKKGVKNPWGRKSFGAEEVGNVVRIEYEEDGEILEATGILKEKATYNKTILIIDDVETIFRKVFELMGLEEREPGVGKPRKKLSTSDALKAIVGPKPLSRDAISKKVWDYIKENNLQDPENKRMIITDDKLKVICGGKKKIGMFELVKLVQENIE